MFFRKLKRSRPGPASLPSNSLAAEPAGYHSAFGGMWIDRADWRRQIEARRLAAADVERVESFVEDGFLILEGAASGYAIDAFQRELERSFRCGNAALLHQHHGRQEVQALDGPVDRLGTRVVDSFVALPQALDLLSSPRLLHFLNLIFGEDPLLFQSLSFDQGSQQGLHQDTAYVVVDRPMEMAACWIALEDVKPGSGELMYAPASHRHPDWPFAPNRKHWESAVDGDEAHESWSQFLRHEAARSPRGIQTFMARKGDILVWHADLAHGGSRVTDPELTRQSLVGHFCPQSARPRYFDHGPRRSRVLRQGRLAYSSGHYDIH